jgi:hypothetical protein
LNRPECTIEPFSRALCSLESLLHHRDRNFYVVVKLEMVNGHSVKFENDNGGGNEIGSMKPHAD